MAQNTTSTEYNGMPRSAIATGLVDYELPPAEMAAQLIAYVAHAFGNSNRIATNPMPKAEGALKRVFVLLRTQTGHDFSLYKPSTIRRRIERRMAVHQIDSIDNYISYIQQTPTEVEALFRDLLIGVTNFFRDPEAFKTLEEQVIPKLFANRPANAVIRIWSPGCSTGEEAYSIAILLQEQMESVKRSCKVQLFATDIDSQAIAIARAGLYPASIAADISPERLARYFVAEPDGSAYRIHKSIRDMMVFSEHDAVKDPPFSRLGFISCRNLLIYMGDELQKRLVALFHYALSPEGVLFLGCSETVGGSDDLFSPIDRKWKLYRRNDNVRDAQRIGSRSCLPPMTAREISLPRTGERSSSTEKTSLRDFTEQALLRHVAPAGALVNRQGDVLYLHGRTGNYFEPTPGEVGVNNILKMAREGLQRELTSALHKAVVSKEIVHCPGLRVKTNGDFTTTNLTIRPVEAGHAANPDVPLYLVILEPFDPEKARPASLQSSVGVESADVDTHVAALKQELRNKEEYLQTANEQLETFNEELQSANEELQSVNEELQSTNEELETSKEELQSVNEELSTVNAELQTKIVDLSRANNDMNNLLAGTGIATVFVDHQLRILRFTPAAIMIINLIISDIGRPVGHIVSNLVNYDRLVIDAQSVLDTLIPKVVDVQTTAGKWYTMRIQPYRTLDNVIEGAVITFADVTEMVQTRDALKQAKDMRRLAVVARDSQDAITVHDLEGRILAWSPGAEKTYGWSESEALAMNICYLIPEDLREDAMSTVRKLANADVIEPYQTLRVAKDGRTIEVMLTATVLVNEIGKVYAISTTERPLRRGVES